MTYQERKYICNKCENLKNRPWRNCTICHCFVDAKVLVKSEKCPIGKWN